MKLTGVATAELTAKMAVIAKSAELGRPLTPQEEADVWIEAWRRGYDRGVENDIATVRALCEAEQKTWRHHVRTQLAGAAALAGTAAIFLWLIY